MSHKSLFSEAFDGGTLFKLKIFEDYLPKLNLEEIDWVIVGGESGRRPRPMSVDWVLDIQQQCKKENVSFFFKQWGGTNKKKSGRMLDGKTYDAMPVIDRFQNVGL